jgi:serine/threonine protein kinase/cytochrome c-type biogenesis protein CcmH/NrfG
MSGAGNLTGKRLGEYHVLELIGHGGFADVYKGKHISQNDQVAIKVLHINYNRHDKQEVANYRALFFSEARMLQSLPHPFIMPLLHAGEHIIDPGQQGVLYMVMEYARNGSLRERLDEYLKKNPGQPLPLQEALTILWQIGQALYFAHQQLKGEKREPVVHLDLKPANILFNDQGDALLADFGLAVILPSAKTKRFNEAGGTYAYMAPEQFDGDVSIKCDQYALGIIAYELLTGQHPFEVKGVHPAQIPVQWYIQHKKTIPEAPHKRNARLSTYISDAILKSLAKDRADRFDSVLNFIEALGPPQPGKTFTDWFIEGNELFERGKYKDAITAYRQVVLLKTGLANVHCNLGDARYKLEQYASAIASFSHAITFDSGHVKAYLNKGITLKRLGRLEEAVDMYQKAVQLVPNHGKAYEYLGDALYALGRYAEAVAAYKEAKYLNVHEANFFTNFGLALKNCHADSEALEIFDYAILLDRRYARAYYSKGNLLFDKGKYTEALEAYETATKIDPNYVNAFRAKGNALRSLGLLEEARLAEEKADKLNHKNQ